MFAFNLDNEYFVHQQGIGLLHLVNDSLQLVPGSGFAGQERMQVMLPYRDPSGTRTASEPKQYLVGLFYSGLFIYDGKNFKPFKTEANPFLKSSTLYKGEMTADGNYILSTTGKGLVTIDAGGKIVQLINRDVGLQDESVYSVYIDSRGILWLGLDNGISRVETNSPITQFTAQSGINTTTLSIERFKGQLYLGTTNGLLRLNSKTGRFEEIGQVPRNQTFALLKDGNTLLVPNDGLFAIRDDKVSLLRPSIGGDMQLTGLYLSKYNPNMLLGGATFGVAVFLRDKKANTWRFEGFVPNLDDQFWTFAENKDGSFWAGTQNGSVYLIKPALDANGQLDVKRFVYEKFGEGHGLRKAAGSVFQIKGENYFLGDSSLFRFDEQQKKFYADTSFGNFEYAGGIAEFDVHEDPKGRLWMRFGKETIIATPQADGKYKIDKTSLLPVAEKTFSKIFSEENGITWICTTDGLIRYDENLHKDYDQNFTTHIRSVNAGKRLLSTATAGSGENAPSVSYRSNTMRFEYAAPFFEQEDKTLYQTWLEGFEPDWSGFDNNYYKEYTNLPAGKYAFHVRAKNVYHKTSDESVYYFSILPPWYATWWAYALYALAALAVIGLIVRYRTRQLKAKHKELEQIV
ncbi:MAG TPA: triple tyrosine motif-containing protein, partial [Chitinophagaceae bacterium]|nr:triple tyrosine motif-containing protein [Chitinophagaceae bacterium]